MSSSNTVGLSGVNLEVHTVGGWGDDVVDTILKFNEKKDDSSSHQRQPTRTKPWTNPDKDTNMPQAHNPSNLRMRGIPTRNLPGNGRTIPSARQLPTTTMKVDDNSQNGLS